MSDPNSDVTFSMCLRGNNGQKEYSRHLSDGLHLRGSGNTLLAEALLDLIKKEFPNLSPLEYEDTDSSKAGRSKLERAVLKIRVQWRSR
mmetsp:Transcript_21518/g.36659  ORF Transcript_21518/g.36659 Transcript_21518/m.36659 type:complete len:89 (+) Transcript_21518:145-411(+)